MDRLKTVSKKTWGVFLWVITSAALTAGITWALGRPELFQYYGLLNCVLYFLNELKKGNEDK